MNLRGKVALVTGGARRVGRALSEALARAGARVVINYNQSAEAAEQLAREIDAIAVRADVSHKREVAALMQRIQDEFGRLDVVINNASLFQSAPFLQITEEMWDRVLDVNLKGPFLRSVPGGAGQRASALGGWCWQYHQHRGPFRAAAVALIRAPQRFESGAGPFDQGARTRACS
jgi:NAD(P)-dependent dehydrogenase (short-subunit alcohol dehydrogenase family)